jgi:hypothetical protein
MSLFDQQDWRFDLAAHPGRRSAFLTSLVASEPVRNAGRPEVSIDEPMLSMISQNAMK